METTGMMMIDTPEKFVEWCRDNGGGVKLQRRGAGIITEYLSAHGQMLSANGEGELFLNSEVMTEKTSLDEVVDQVCDWNYRELVDTRCRKENPADFLDYCKSCTMEKELEEHKFILDRIFKQTVYGREIRTMAHKLALEMMKEMHLVPAFDMEEMQEMGTHDKAVGKSADSVKPNLEEMDEDKDNSKMLAGPESTEAVGEPGIVGINTAGNVQSSMVGLAMEEIENKKQEGRAR